MLPGDSSSSGSEDESSYSSYSDLGEGEQWLCGDATQEAEANKISGLPQWVTKSSDPSVKQQEDDKNALDISGAQSVAQLFEGNPKMKNMSQLELDLIVQRQKFILGEIDKDNNGPFLSEEEVNIMLAQQNSLGSFWEQNAVHEQLEQKKVESNQNDLIKQPQVAEKRGDYAKTSVEPPKPRKTDEKSKKLAAEEMQAIGRYIGLSRALRRKLPFQLQKMGQIAKAKPQYKQLIEDAKAKLREAKKTEVVKAIEVVQQQQHQQNPPEDPDTESNQQTSTLSDSAIYEIQ